MKPFILFDAYGTLLELDDFYRRLQHGFDEKGVPLPLQIVKWSAHREMRHYMANARSAVSEASWLKLRRECAAILADGIRDFGCSLPLGRNDVLEVLGEAIVFRPFPESLPVLQELQARGIGMGVASNWDYQLPLALENAGLGVFFDFIVSSAQIGEEKPAPEFFDYAQQQVKLARPDADTIFYIGDHYEKDVLASRAAGLTPLWLVRDKRDLASGDTHDSSCDVTRLQTLRDLPALF